MPVLNVLGSFRHPSRCLTRWVLVWFACACLAAIAAPVMQPQGATLVCTAAGEVKWVSADAVGDPADPGPALDAARADGHHMLDCVLCLPLLAPPAATPARGMLPRTAHRVRAADFAPFVPRTGYSKLAARGPPAAA